QHAGPDRILDVVVDVGDLVGHPDDPAFGGGGPGPFGVGDDAVAHLPGQVEAPAVFFQPVHHPQALFIVLEAAGAQGVQRPLPCVAERGVARSWARATASVRSSLRRRARAMVRAIWDTSSVWVNRVR